MSKLKKALALFLTMAMLLTAVPVTALAAEAVPEDLTAVESGTEPEAPAEEPETPVEEPEVPAEEPETPVEEPEVPAEEPETPVEEPEVPAEEPETPVEEPEVPAEEPEAPAEEPEAPAEEPEIVEQTTAQEISHQTVVNPLYADYAPPTNRTAPAKGSQAVVDSTCYQSASAAGSAMRGYLKSRTNYFTITYTDNQYPSDTRIEQIVEEYAMAHTGNPTEGDYLMWQWYQYGYGGKYSQNGSTYTVYLTLEFEYYTTASQERAVDTAVYNLRKSLGLSSKNDYETVNAIYSWICSNVEYDYAHVDWGQNYPLQFTAYGAIIDKVCVCQGYAVLFYRMALEEGIDARVITGDGGGPHAWNIVELNNKYYNLDSTWDAGYTESNWRWFLRCPNNFTDHSRDSEYNTSSFHSKYPMDNVDYVKRIKLSAPVLVSVSNQTNGVKLTWKAVANATSYDVYRRTNGGSWVNIKNVKGTSYSNTGVASGNTYTYTVRAKTGSLQSSCNGTGLTIRYLETPVVKSATNTTSGVQVKWNAVGKATSYQVWRKTSNTSWVKVGSPVSGTSCTDRSAQSGTTYYYTVRALAGSAQSSYYSSGKKVIYVATPAVQSATNTTSGVQVKWNAVSKATGYQVWRKTSGTSWMKLGSPVSGTSYTDRSAQSGTTYYYTVRALAGSAQSSYYSSGKKAIYVVTPTVKSATNANGGVQVKWNAVEKATGYQLWRKTSSTSWVKVGSPTTSTTYLDRSAQSGTTYYYTVRALCGSAQSSYYSSGRKILYVATPVLKSASNVSDGVKVTWGAVSGATQYQLWRKTANSSWAKVGSPVSGTSCTDRTAKPGTTYIYTVRAFCGTVQGSYNSTGISVRCV